MELLPPPVQEDVPSAQTLEQTQQRLTDVLLKAKQYKLRATKAERALAQVTKNYQSLKTKFRNLSALHSKCAAQKSPAVHTSKPTPGKAARNRAFRELKPHHKNSRSIPQNTPRSVVRKTGVKKTTPAKVGTKMRSLTSAAGKNSIAEDKGPSVRSESRGSALESSLLASPAHARESVKRRRSKGHVAAPSPKVPKASPTLSTASLRSYRAAAESVNSEGKSLQMQRFLLPSQESTDSESPSKECHPTATQSPDGKNREHRSAVFAEVRPKDPTSPPAIVGPVVVNNVLPPKNTKPNRKNEFRVVRNKDERAGLIGSACEVCKRFYEVSGTKALLTCHCSRHRTSFEPKPSPEGFWDLGWDGLLTPTQ